MNRRFKKKKPEKRVGGLFAWNMSEEKTGPGMRLVKEFF
jgi:hypothetical protein